MEHDVVKALVRIPLLLEQLVVQVGMGSRDAVVKAINQHGELGNIVSRERNTELLDLTKAVERSAAATQNAIRTLADQVAILSGVFAGTIEDPRARGEFRAQRPGQTLELELVKRAHAGELSGRALMTLERLGVPADPWKVGRLTTRDLEKVKGCGAATASELIQWVKRYAQKEC